MDPITLEELDVDGALRESLDTTAGDSRADFMAKAVKAAGGLVGGGALLALPALAKGKLASSDVKILNFALTLEFLEHEFYVLALKQGGAPNGRERAFARVTANHEGQHVRTLQSVLGGRAIKKPKFDFRGTTENRFAFRATAVTLEDTGVAAYKGQAPFVRNTDVLKAALAIHSVEANHAAWIRRIVDGVPAAAPLDSPKTMAQVLAAVKSTRFIVG
jgi:rubrerythrin